MVKDIWKRTVCEVAKGVLGLGGHGQWDFTGRWKPKPRSHWKEKVLWVIKFVFMFIVHQTMYMIESCAVN